MAMHFAKGKKRASAQAQEKGAHAETGAHAQALETGVCIICGGMLAGTPASPEFLILAARRLRSILRQQPRHTIACAAHLEEAKGMRAKFEKRRRDYSYGAMLFFAIAAGGSFFFGRGDLGLFIPSLIGALVIAALPFFYYFPSFGK